MLTVADAHLSARLQPYGAPPYGFASGSGGGTPHSGVPFGRGTRFISQSSVGCALSRCRKKTHKKARSAEK